MTRYAPFTSNPRTPTGSRPSAFPSGMKISAPRQFPQFGYPDEPQKRPTATDEQSSFVRQGTGCTYQSGSEPTTMRLRGVPSTSTMVRTGQAPAEGGTVTPAYVW